MKTNHDGTLTLNAYDTWTSCSACGQRVTGDSIHTCSPQLKTLTDEEIYACFHQYFVLGEPKPTHYELEYEDLIDFAKAILRKAQEK